MEGRGIKSRSSHWSCFLKPLVFEHTPPLGACRGGGFEFNLLMGWNRDHKASYEEMASPVHVTLYKELDKLESTLITS
jgi:hypothetical protein